MDFILYEHTNIFSDFNRMPYEIIKSGKGYKVKSESGTLLSKKPLSKTRATKQKIAATLSSLRSGDLKKK